MFGACRTWKKKTIASSACSSIGSSLKAQGKSILRPGLTGSLLRNC